MARTPDYNWSKQPQWVQDARQWQSDYISELQEENARLEGIVATLEGLFVQAAVSDVLDA